MWQLLVRLLVTLASRFTWPVLIGAGIVTGIAGTFAARIEVKTSFQDVMSNEEPTVARMRYLTENFPGAVNVRVLLEGNEPERLIEVAKEIEAEVLKSEAVRAVYLEQPIDFFARRALLFLPEQDLRLLEASLAKNHESLSTLLADPSVLGLLRAMDTLAKDTFAADDLSFTVSGRVFGKFFYDQLLAGNPGGTIGMKVDPKQLTDKLDKRTLETMRKAPVPPSDKVARKNLKLARIIFELFADVLEQGEGITPELFEKRVDKLRDINAPGLPQRYNFSPDKHLLLMDIAGKDDLTLYVNIAPMLTAVQDATKKIGQRNADVKIGLTGMPVAFVQEQEAILGNMLLVTVLGFLGILAVFVIGFERVLLPSLAVIPLLAGIMWTFGIQSAVVGELNILNLLFPILLFGLGIDFAIHIMSAYVEARGEGLDEAAALHHALSKIIQGLVVGAITTGAAFLVLLFGHLKGLRDLGFTAGVGVTCALLSTLILLPPILLLWDRHTHKSGVEVPAVEFRVLGRIGHRMRRSRYGVFALFLVITVVFAYFAPRVGVERDASKLSPRGLDSQAVTERILKAYKVSGTPSVFFADSIEEAREIHKRALAARTISDPISITAAIPEGQERKAPLIKAIAQRLDALTPSKYPPPHTYDEKEMDELKDRLAAIKRSSVEISMISNILYQPETAVMLGEIRDSLNRIDRWLSIASSDRLIYLDGLIAKEVSATLDVLRDMTRNTSITVDDLPRSLVERVHGKDGKWLVLVRANSFVFQEDFLAAHTEELKSIHPTATGLIPAWRVMLDKIVKDISYLTILTFITVFFVVLFGLRNFKGTLLALVPLVVGMIWTVGVLGLLGVDYNFISLLSIPLIVGIGIDDGVHLYHRIREDRSLPSALAHCGKPIILTTLTTGIGFASLLLSVHRGVFFLGLTTAVGVTACLIVTIFLLPALVAIFDEKTLMPDPTEAARQAEADAASAAAAAADRAKEAEEDALVDASIQRAKAATEKVAEDDALSSNEEEGP